MARSGRWHRIADKYRAVGESADWQLCLEAYDRDDLETAWEIAQSLSIGADTGGLLWQWMLEAEVVCRRQSSVQQLTPNLAVESTEPLTEEEIEHLRQAMTEVNQDWCTDQPRALRFVFLASAEGAGWFHDEFSYYTRKVPYGKVCLAPGTREHDGELKQIVKHEYAHVLTDEWSEGAIEPWLDEAFAGYTAEDDYSDLVHRMGWNPLDNWLAPDELSWVFEGALQGEHQPETTYGAYHQACLLGRALVQGLGRNGMRNLVELHARETLGRRLRQHLLGQNATDRSFHDHGLPSPEQWFEQVRESLMTGGGEVGTQVY